MSYPFGEAVFRDRRPVKANAYNPSRETVGAWSDFNSTDETTIQLEGVYVSNSSQTAVPDAVRLQLIEYLSLYSRDPAVDVQPGDRIRTGSGRELYCATRPLGDVNPFTGWSPGVEIPLTTTVG